MTHLPGEPSACPACGETDRRSLGLVMSLKEARRPHEIPPDDPTVATFSWGCASCGERWGPPHEAAVRVYLDALRRERPTG
jgi:hypothetical protein